MKSQFMVNFFGVRGSSAANSQEHIPFGCNTSCVLVTLGEKHVILDMGTGLIRLGEYFAASNIHEADILLSHPHYDHIEGFPFFNPFYKEGSYRIYGVPPVGSSMQNLLKNYMRVPYFPVTPEVFNADISYCDLQGSTEFSLGEDITVKTLPVLHPGGSCAYRIDFQKRSVTYLVDYEHGGDNQEEVLSFCADTDLLIYDGTYTQEEYDNDGLVGWGHSTHQQGVILAQLAGVKKLVLTHHAHTRSAAALADIEKGIQVSAPTAMMAREGLRIII